MPWSWVNKQISRLLVLLFMIVINNSVSYGQGGAYTPPAVEYCGPKPIIDHCNPNRLALQVKVDYALSFQTNMDGSRLGDNWFSNRYDFSLTDNENHTFISTPNNVDSFNYRVTPYYQSSVRDLGSTATGLTYVVKDMNNYHLTLNFNFTKQRLEKYVGTHKWRKHLSNIWEGYHPEIFENKIPINIPIDIDITNIGECKDTVFSRWIPLNLKSLGICEHYGWIDIDPGRGYDRDGKVYYIEPGTFDIGYTMFFRITLHWQKLNNDAKKLLVDFPDQDRIDLCANEFPYVLRGAQPDFVTHTWSINELPSPPPVITENNLQECLYLEHSFEDSLIANFQSNFILPSEYCLNSTPIVINTIHEPDLKITPGRDTLICRGQNITFTVPGGQPDYKWYKINKIWTDSCDRIQSDKNCIAKGDSSLTVSEPGMYMVEVFSTNGCIARDTVNVSTSNLAAAKINASTVFLCGDDNSALLKVNNPDTYQSFNWSTGSTDNSITVTEPGCYSLTAIDKNNCYSFDAVSISNSCIDGFDGKSGHSVVRQMNLSDIDLEDSGTNAVSVNDDNAGTYPTDDLVRYMYFVKLNYHRSHQSDVSSNNFKLIITYSLTIDGVTTTGNTLAISHKDADKVYQAINAYASTLGTGTIQITGITPDVTLSSDIMNDINVELELKTFHLPKIETTTAIDDMYLNEDIPNRKLTITWTPKHEAVEYELQWAYKDIYSRENISSTQLLKDQGVSVVTAENYYTLDIAYPEGTLYYRVRPLGRFNKGTNNNYAHIKYGAWNEVEEYNISHENCLDSTRSWQRTTTFAEEGKKKDVVSYYDDFLRPSQVVTNLNTQQLSLRAGTYYDHEGRGVLSVLPSPSLNNNLLFDPDMNTVGGNPLSKEDLDNGMQPKLDTTSGAAQYYSSINPFLSSSKFFANTIRIPKGAGYVTTQTQYMRDNTGRIVKQSGVGEEFALDSNQYNNKHYTQYFYNSVPDNELIRLFGSNTGKAKHYQKNMVIDPNDQISISYVDMFGRTVATCLAGEVPKNLKSISVDSGEYVMPLSNNNVFDHNARSASVNYSFSNEIKYPNNRDTFMYDLDGWVDQLSGQIEFCRTCIYKVKIALFDPNGRPVPLNPITYNSSKDSFKLNTLETTFGAGVDCSDPPLAYDSIVFDAVINQIGNYSITKELSILSSPIDSMQMDTLTGVLSYEAFRDSLLSGYLDSSACNFGCREYVIRYIQDSTGEAYNESDPDQKSLYDSLYGAWCDPVKRWINDSAHIQGVDCERYLEQMKSQVSPGGQYFTPSFIAQYKDSIEPLKGFTGTAQAILDSVQSNWLPEYADSFAIYHPEYCHYLNCTNDAYDNFLNYYLSMTFSWTEAHSKGFDDSSFYREHDNYFNLYDNKFYHFYDVIRNRNVAPIATLNLFEYVDWTNLTYSDYYNPQKSLYADVDFSGFNYSAGPPNYGLSDAVVHRLDTLKWTHFRDLLLSMKQEAKAKNEEASGCRYLPDDSAVVKYPVPNRGKVLTDNEIDSIERETCQQSCGGFADRYFSRIMDYCSGGTTFTTADTLELKRLLSKFCNGNCGIDNPIGLFDPEDTLSSKTDSIRLFLSSKDRTCYWDSITVYNMPVKYQYVTDSLGDTIKATVCTPDGIEALLIYAKNKLNYSGHDTSGYGQAKQILAEWGMDTASFVLLNDHITFHKGANGNCSDPVCVNTFYFLDSSGQKIKNIKDIVFAHRIYQSPLGAGALYQYYANSIIPYFAQYEVVLIDDEADTLKYRRAYLYMLSYNWQGSGCFLDFKGSCVSKPIKIWNIDSLPFLQQIPDSCLSEVTERAGSTIRDIYQSYLDSIRLSLTRGYVDSCFKFTERFLLKYKLHEYQYTLYYYDQAGNLVQTVPPEGVYPLAPSHFNSHGVWDGTEPQHVLKTQYRYNTRNQVIWQKTPDADSSCFWYNDKGQLILSQNAKQKLTDKFSFTFYDHLGRIYVVGEIDSTKARFSVDSVLKDIRFPLDARYYPDSSVSQLTITLYDHPLSTSITDFKQSNLRNRVSASYYADSLTSNYILQYPLSANDVSITLSNDFATYLGGNVALTAYTYDEVGNVKSLNQQINRQKLEPLEASVKNKRIDYEYDLISGKVNKVTYQPGKYDQFTHRYEYDADNRITDVYTSRDGIVESHEAKYFYYPHGPLARIEIGQDKVQGEDYYYTLQGWMKGINNSNVSESNDPGQDANAAVVTSANDTLNKYVPHDQFNELLAYYKNDYTPIDPSFTGTGSIFDNSTVMPWYENITDPKFKGLYNGNIAFMATGLPALGGLTEYDKHWQMDQYQYDQLNRIVSSVSCYPTGEGYDHNVTTAYSYDKNGNILKLDRYGINGTVQLMDSLLYNYTYSSGKLVSNKLNYVDDRQTDNSRFSEDIDDQNSGNYDYDAIGQLTKDASEHIEKIEWNVYGKISRIIFNNGKPTMEFRYDAKGDRIAKLLTNALQPAETDTVYTATYYWRDAQGNILTTESRKFYDLPGVDPPIAATVTHPVEVEYNLYGSSRLGTFQDTLRYDISTPGVYGMYERWMAKRQYELSNHLGNVSATISDVKTYNTSNSDYEATVLSAQHYYPFGMQMPGKVYNLDHYSSLKKYRFGFNGMERDDEVKGTGSWYQFGDFGYDPRIGRRNNTDPVVKSWQSSYATFANNPIVFIDPSGYNEEIPNPTGGTTTYSGDGASTSSDKKTMFFTNQNDADYSNWNEQTQSYSDDHCWGDGACKEDAPERSRQQESVNLSQSNSNLHNLVTDQQKKTKDRINTQLLFSGLEDYYSLDRKHGQVASPRPPWLNTLLGNREYKTPDMPFPEYVDLNGYRTGHYNTTLTGYPPVGLIISGGSGIWTSTKNLTSVENAFAHWLDHGAEFPEFNNAKQYVEGAKTFLQNSPEGTLMKVRTNGDILKYNPASNTFGVMNSAGIPRTLFKPEEGIEYWLKQ